MLATCLPHICMYVSLNASYAAVKHMHLPEVTVAHQCCHHCGRDFESAHYCCPKSTTASLVLQMCIITGALYLRGFYSFKTCPCDEITRREKIRCV